MTHTTTSEPTAGSKYRLVRTPKGPAHVEIVGAEEGKDVRSGSSARAAYEAVCKHLGCRQQIRLQPFVVVNGAHWHYTCAMRP